MDNTTSVSKDLFSKKFADLCTRGGGSGFPKDELDQHILFKSVTLTIPPDASLNEQEVNEKLATWINIITHLRGLDHITLRRYLVEAGYLARSSDGAVYRVNPGALSQPNFDPGIQDLDLTTILTARREEIERRKQEFMAKAKK